MLATDTATLARDARWLPHRLLDGGARLRFILADREAQRGASFLDDDHLGEGRPRADVAIADLLRAEPAAPAPIHFIFHSAFARSTLLARALDLPGHAMGLKEPIILNDAAQLLRARRLGGETLELVVRLLERPLAPGERIVVKPSNAANPLMPELLRLRPQARALVLYRPLPDFLRSVARKGMFGRIWARRQLAAIRSEAPFDAGFSADDLFIQTDLQAAAFGWLIQQAQFAALARAWPERVRMLDADALVADRQAAFAATCDWFGIDLDAAAVARVVAGPNFSEDSKRLGEPFQGQRTEESAPIDQAEIMMVTKWIEAVAEHVQQPLAIGPSLLLDNEATTGFG